MTAETLIYFCLYNVIIATKMFFSRGFFIFWEKYYLEEETILKTEVIGF